MTEFYPSAEMASQDQLSVALGAMRKVLKQRGLHADPENVRRMTDGTAIYEVKDDMSFSDELETYQIGLAGKDVELLSDETRQKLSIGNKVLFTYTPTHYLLSKSSGSFDAYPEYIQAEIVTEESTLYDELTLAVTHRDIDSRVLVGNRYAVPRKSRAEEEAMTGDMILDRVENAGSNLASRLGEISAAECQALIDAAHSLSRY